MMVYGGGAFGRLLGPEGGALVNGISALLGRNTQRYSLSQNMRAQPEGSRLQIRKRTFTRNQTDQHLALGLPGLQNCGRETSAA